MNKLILIMAICLINVHAFVKRETEVAHKNDWFEDFQNQFQTFKKNFEEKAVEQFKPDEIKKNLQAFVDTFEKAINDLKASTEKKN